MTDSSTEEEGLQNVIDEYEGTGVKKIQIWGDGGIPSKNAIHIIINLRINLISIILLQIIKLTLFSWIYLFIWSPTTSCERGSLLNQEFAEKFSQPLQRWARRIVLIFRLSVCKGKLFFHLTPCNPSSWVVLRKFLRIVWKEYDSGSRRGIDIELFQ